MSALLDEIIAASRAKAIEYKEYLRHIAELAKKVEAGHEEDTPEPLKNNPAVRAIYNNLKNNCENKKWYQHLDGKTLEYSVEGDPILNLAMIIDEAIKRVRPDDWRGYQTKE